MAEPSLLQGFLKLVKELLPRVMHGLAHVPGTIIAIVAAMIIHESCSSMIDDFLHWLDSWSPAFIGAAFGVALLRRH